MALGGSDNLLAATMPGARCTPEHDNALTAGTGPPSKVTIANVTIRPVNSNDHPSKYIAAGPSNKLYRPASSPSPTTARIKALAISTQRWLRGWQNSLSPGHTGRGTWPSRPRKGARRAE